MDRDDRRMVRYAGGDVSAFEALYADHEDRVYGFCLRRLDDPDAAADAFQDTWRRVVEGRRGYEPQGKFESWLFTLARRACADRRRSDREHASLEADERPAREPTSGGAPPDTRLAREDELRRLLDRLTDAQREALLLSKYEGFSYAEVAEMTGTTEAAVKQRVYRALRTLRTEER
jgi:RNA polymerase sigma-70 factor (ECF subfamily)